MIFFLRIVFGFLLISAAEAKVQVSVSPSEVPFGQPFQLLLVDEDGKDVGTPNLQILTQDFDIVSTAHSMRFSFVNGRSQMRTEWVVQIVAKKPGPQNIPSITLGSEHSLPLTVRVLNPAAPEKKKETEKPAESRAPTTLPEPNLFVQTTLSRTPAFIHQQLRYTVKILYNTQILDARYKEPQVEDALLIPLDAGPATRTLYQGKIYAMREQRYAIFPQKSGPLTVQPPMFTALLYDTPPRKRTAYGSIQTKEIMPTPSDWGKSPWLPAEQVVLKEHYDDGGRPLAIGKALVRTVTVDIKGLPAQLIPKLDFNAAPHTAIYPEKAEEHTHLQQGELYGTLTMKVTYLIKEAGTITLPAIELPWFNVQSGKKETAVVPARTFTVAGVKTATPKERPKTEPSSSTAPRRSSSYRSAALWGAVLALFFLPLLWKAKKPQSKKPSLKAAVADIHSACKKNQAPLLRDALLRWGTLRWPSAAVMNLSFLAEQVQSLHLTEAIQTLSASLYGQNSAESWDGAAFWRVFSVYSSACKKVKKSSAGLPPANPV